MKNFFNSYSKNIYYSFCLFCLSYLLIFQFIQMDINKRINIYNDKVTAINDSIYGNLESVKKLEKDLNSILNDKTDTLDYICDSLYNVFNSKTLILKSKTKDIHDVATILEKDLKIIKSLKFANKFLFYFIFFFSLYIFHEK